MRIALFNAFPGLAISAEKEFIQRSVNVLTQLGHEAREVYTSDEVVAFEPDFVLATHEYIPKTTEHFTVGLLWSPTVYYKNDPLRVKNIGSWDLVVPANEDTRQFADDLHFSLRRRSDVSRSLIYPSSSLVDIDLPDMSKLSLAYVGVHWDGARHQALFRALSDVVPLSVYGPPDAWSYLPAAYRGPIPVDGRAVVETLNRHGIVLAAHKRTHRDGDAPSMRVFESCAAKCLVITDEMPSLRRRFGDSFEYVDMNAGAKVVAGQIAEIVHAACLDQEETARRIRSAHAIFAEQVSLEALLPPLVAEVRARIEQRRSGRKRADAPAISVIIRCGSRPLSTVARAVRSLQSQLYPNIEIIFARFAEIEGFAAFVEGLRATGGFKRITIVDVQGPPMRSTSLWTGLRQVNTPYFAVLDDDDEIFPDHFQHIMWTFETEPKADVVFSGAIRHEEEGLPAIMDPRLRREDGTFVAETRELHYFEPFDISRMLRIEPMITSNAFVARSSLLTDIVLEDPELEILEDFYLNLLVATNGAIFVFNGRASVVFNWRSESEDNSRFEIDHAMQRRSAERIFRRFSYTRFPISLTGSTVLGRGVSVAEVAKNPTCPLPSVEPYNCSLEEGIDFGRQGMPIFIESATGLSHREDWGRWTDGDRVRFQFVEPLPAQFLLELRCHPYGPNVDHDFIVEVGSARTSLRMINPDTATYFILVENPDVTGALTIYIPKPVRPATSGFSNDQRKLGLALVSLKIKPPDQHPANNQRSQILRRWRRSLGNRLRHVADTPRR